MKRGRVILGFLLAGAVVNVVIAWAITSVYARDYDGVARLDHLASPSGDSWVFNQFETVGYTQIHSVPSSSMLDRTGFYVKVPNIQIPWWSRMNEPPLPSNRQDGTESDPMWNWRVAWISETASGLPFHSLYARHEKAWPSQRIETHWRLLWPGFLLDTAVFAVAFWLAWWLRCLIRRILFTRPSNESTHGDPILLNAAHTACPECGTPVRKERTA